MASPRLDRAIDRAVRAWVVPGPNPTYNRRMQQKLLNEWPALACAMQELAQAYAHEPPGGMTVTTQGLEHADTDTRSRPT